MEIDDLKEAAGVAENIEEHIVNVKELTEEDKIGIDIDDSDLKEYDKDLKAATNDSERLLPLIQTIQQKIHKVEAIKVAANKYKGIEITDKDNLQTIIQKLQTLSKSYKSVLYNAKSFEDALRVVGHAEKQKTAAYDILSEKTLSKKTSSYINKLFSRITDTSREGLYKLKEKTTSVNIKGELDSVAANQIKDLSLAADAHKGQYEQVIDDIIDGHELELRNIDRWLKEDDERYRKQKAADDAIYQANKEIEAAKAAELDERAANVYRTAELFNASAKAAELEKQKIAADSAYQANKKIEAAKAAEAASIERRIKEAENQYKIKADESVGDYEKRILESDAFLKGTEELSIGLAQTKEILKAINRSDSKNVRSKRAELGRHYGFDNQLRAGKISKEKEAEYYEELKKLEDQYAASTNDISRISALEKSVKANKTKYENEAENVKTDLEGSLKGLSEDAKEYIKGLKDQLKEITGDESLSAAEKAFRIQELKDNVGYTAKNDKEAKAVAEEYGKINSALMQAKRKEIEDLRKTWKDALKADVVTAQSNINNATTQEDKEAAQAQLVKASERYENFLENVQAAGSKITNDSEIAKAKADIKKAKADLDESLEEVSKEAEEYIKGIKDQVKAITSDKSLSADEKAFKIQQIQQGYGYKVRNKAEAQAVQDQYNDLTKLNSDLMRASQAEDELKQKALDVAAANRKIAEADTTDKQITEHRNLAGIYRQQAAATTDAAAREDLLTEATKEEARAQEILDKELAKARQIAKDAQQAFMQIVDMVNSATNKVIGLIRSSIGLANRGVNATVNGGQKIVSTLGRVVQLFGSLSNRVRSCIATVINFARSTTQALGRVLNGVRSLIAHFNIFNRQAAGKNGLSLVFTELNSAISLAERAFNGLFNNQLLAKSIKFDSTIASITMLLGGEATDDTQRFASALQDAFGISYSQTISDLQEITSLLKAAGLEASGLTGTGIANAAQDLYAISQYFGALGMAGGSAAEVMSKLESGMKGMTQSIDDLGLSVRENDMNEFLKDKGYNIKFSNLSEANKETVRLAAILEQFNNNFDILDFSKLLEQPYYQISLIKSQINEIGTIIGKIFQGIIGKFLPYILGALNFVRTQLEGLAGKLGIDLSGDEVQKSLEGVKDTVDGITDSEKDAAKAAKDYTNTAGFDEITSLNSGSSDQDMNLSNLLTDVGSISDKLQGVGADQKSLVEELKEKWSEFVKDTLGKDTDPFFGFNSGKAKKSLGNIGKNIQRWWKSFKETTLTLGLKFADDLQAGRFANDVLRLVDAITKLVAIIQEQLSPVVQDFYDKHLSKYVKEFGDKFHKFSKDFKKRVNQLDKDLKGGMTFGDAWKKNFGSILPPDLQTRLEKIVKIVKTLYKEYITPIKDAVLTTFDTMGTLSMGGLNIVDSTITKGEEGESLLDKVLGNYQTFSKDKLQPWIESTTNSIASYIETHKTEIANLIDQIANDLFDVFTLLADIVGKLITWNIENPEMLNTIAETAKNVLGFVSDNFDTIMRIVELFVQLISASIDGLLSGIQIIFDKIAELDTVKPGEDKSQLQNIIDNVCKFIKAIWEDLGTGISNLLQWVSDNEGALTGALIVIEGLTSFFSNHVVGLLNAIIAIKTVTGIVSVINNLTKFAGAIKTVGSALGLVSSTGTAATAAEGAAAAAGVTGASLAGAAAGVAAAAVGGLVVGGAIGTAIDKEFDISGKLAKATTKASDDKAARRLEQLALMLNSENAETREQAQALLEKEFRLKPEDLDPFMKQVEGSSAKQLDMSQLTVDSLGNVTTEMADGRTVMVAALQDIIAEDAKIAEDQKSLLERIYDRIPTDAYQGMKELQFKEDTGGYYQALQYAKRPIKIRALGGSVPSGQLFIANEAGNPELIGQIGKKTGADVANRGMITDAMETAVYNGLVDALNQSRQQATTGTSTPTTINVNGFGLIDKNALRQFAKILAPYLSANKDSFITA